MSVSVDLFFLFRVIDFSYDIPQSSTIFFPPPLFEYSFSAVPLLLPFVIREMHATVARLFWRICRLLLAVGWISTWGNFFFLSIILSLGPPVGIFFFFYYYKKGGLTAINNTVAVWQAGLVSK